MNYADVLLVFLLAGAAYSGYRRGLITAMLTLFGAVGGALLGVWTAPMVAGRLDNAVASVAVGIAMIVLGVGLGEWVGQWIGSRVARLVTWHPAVAVDHGLGLVGHAVGVLIVSWLVAVPLAAAPMPWLSSQIRSSAVLTGVNAAMPESAVDVSRQIRDVFVGSDFPQILAPLAPAPDFPVPAPDAGIAQSPSIRGDQQSVLKIRSAAPSCSRSLEGTGFVVGPALVMTNAHVVAGAQTVRVEDGSDVRPATVVLYNPDVDLAILRVPGLDRPALPFAADRADSGDDAAAVGYPLDGPFTVTPARIRSELPLRGPNIYGDRTVVRDVYSLRGTIQPGNSGGPLLAADGSVLGVVFGAAIDNPQVGFALTAEEVEPALAEGRTATAAVSTGSCTT